MTSSTCPVCGRRIDAIRERCLYCGGAPFADGPVSRRPSDSPEELIPGRLKGAGGHLVVVLPGAPAAAAEGLAPLLGTDLFGARQFLLRPAPQTFRATGERAAVELERRLRGVGLEVVRFRWEEIDAVPDAVLVKRLRLTNGEGLEARTLEGVTLAAPLSSAELLVAGKVEIASSKQFRTRGFAEAANEMVEYVDEHSTVRDYDAFNVFDLYGVSESPLRLLEAFTSIEGAGFESASRGAPFARFEHWLRERRPELPIDAHYRRLGRDHVSEVREAGGRAWAVGIGSKTSEGTEHLVSGQGWDEYSARAWTILRRSRSTDEPG